MRIAVIIILLSAGLTNAQVIGGREYPTGEELKDPCREVRGVRYNLRPLFYYWTTDHRKTGQIRPPALADWEALHFHVSQVGSNDLLVSISNYSEYRNRTFVLRNYPKQKQVVDHDDFWACAIRLPDRVQYHNIRGSICTVDQYDYGTVVPCPEPKKKDEAK